MLRVPLANLFLGRELPYLPREHAQAANLARKIRPEGLENDRHSLPEDEIRHGCGKGQRSPGGIWDRGALWGGQPAQGQECLDNDLWPAYFIFDEDGSLKRRAAGNAGISMLEPILDKMFE